MILVVLRSYGYLSRQLLCHEQLDTQKGRPIGMRCNIASPNFNCKHSILNFFRMFRARGVDGYACDGAINKILKSNIDAHFASFMFGTLMRISIAHLPIELCVFHFVSALY